MTLVETWIRTPLVAAAGWTLFHSLWEGTVIAITLAASLLLIRSSRGRYAAACVALLTVIMAFGVTLMMLASRQGIQKLTYPLDGGIVLNGSNESTLIQGAELWSMADILPWAVPVWILGVVFCYIRHCVSWMAAQRLRRRGVCSAPAFWQERLTALADRLQVPKPVTLLESCFVDVPVVVGQIRPMILIPLGLLAGLPATQVEALLLHELAHIRRYDYGVNLLQKSIEALLFYHPAIWWMSRTIREERENCCDDLVVATKGDVQEYARALTALEENRGSARAAVLAATGGNLMKRIRRLLRPPEGPSVTFTPLLSAGIFLLAAVVSIAVWQPQPTQGAPAPPVAVEQSQVALSPETQNPIVPRAIISPRDQGTAPPNQPQQDSALRRWVTDDVGYIIEMPERAAFESLQTDEEREQFIKQFWLRRDPSPDTPENEFREEHYRRIAEANQRFASSSGTAGWKTDRGRIYILYGKPNEMESHIASGGQGRPYSTEFWLYRFVNNGGNAMFQFAQAAANSDFRLVTESQLGTVPADPLRDPFSMHMRASLPKMLEMISDMMNLSFVISRADNQGTVAVNVDNASKTQILDAIFLPIGLQYEIDGNRVTVTRR